MEPKSQSKWRGLDGLEIFLRGEEGEVPASAPLDFAGRQVVWVFPGAGWAMGIQKGIGRGFPISPITLGATLHILPLVTSLT